MALIHTQNISEDECMGDSLSKINSNFANLDGSAQLLSATLVTNFNTLIRSLTGFAASGTEYTSLSTSFRSLSSFIIN
jgi:hypothetical protein